MRDSFCDWCAKCTKYLTFGTFERTDESALNDKHKFKINNNLSLNSVACIICMTCQVGPMAVM